jgi:RNA-directed DNA polymerase
VNWILDADIKGFFDNISHEWMMRFAEHRIGDRRVLRLIRKWLKAGVVEDEIRQPVTKGTPQGAVISPLLANIYLHYVYDLWADQWRKRHARGAMVVVRYADDTVVGFEHRADAERFLVDLRIRMAEFDLELHPDKTRLIEFGRHAASDRAGRGDGRPETFNFLGFTHICSRSRRGGFLLSRHTRRDRKMAKLLEITEDLRRRWHQDIAEQGRWLGSVVRGFFAYHAVPTNLRALSAFRHHVVELWRRALRRRSQKDRTSWTDMDRLADRWLPKPRISHPWPSVRFRVKHPRWEPYAGIPLVGLCGGRSVMGIPTAFKILAQIGIDHVGVTAPKQGQHRLDRIARAAFRPIAVRGRIQIHFEDRPQYQFRGGLHNTIPYRRDTERTLAAAGLRDYHPPHRLALIRLRT